MKTLFAHYAKGKDLSNTQQMLRESRRVQKHLDGWVCVTLAAGILRNNSIEKQMSNSIGEGMFREETTVQRIETR